ncbi:hypothetical protein MTO96_007115 [Rhipicephalus appendiculatus]
MPLKDHCISLPINAYTSPNVFTPTMATDMMAWPGVRASLSWLLLDAHLTDVTKRCLKEGPFERVKKFRKFHYQPRLPLSTAAAGGLTSDAATATK